MRRGKLDKECRRLILGFARRGWHLAESEHAGLYCMRRFDKVLYITRAGGGCPAGIALMNRPDGKWLRPDMRYTRGERAAQAACTGSGGPISR